MERVTSVSGKTPRLKDTAFMSGAMETSMKENGLVP